MRKLDVITNIDKIFIKYSPNIQSIMITNDYCNYEFHLNPMPLWEILQESKTFSYERKRFIPNNDFMPVYPEYFWHLNELYACLSFPEFKFDEDEITLYHTRFGVMDYNLNKQCFQTYNFSNLTFYDNIILYY